MKEIIVDFSRVTGKIKPMHAVNNAPVAARTGGSMEMFREAGIPFVRTHDSAHYSGYGGCHVIDVENIFTDFSADEKDPSNYDFQITDEYCMKCEKAGSKVFYRLGASIEHYSRKYHTRVLPENYEKYARVCVNIIRHLCCGWAEGYHFDIEYIEIWNEADNMHADGTNPCWQGTLPEFEKFYSVMAGILKTTFPEKKIGGPAYTRSYEGYEPTKSFVKHAAENNVPLDFFSWHTYCRDPEWFTETSEYTRRLLDSYGYTDTELILNEWNYVTGWQREAMLESYRLIGGVEGMAFCAASMLIAQKSPLSMLMYYNARPGTPFNGIFETPSYKKKKGYYAFSHFGHLYRLQNEVYSASEAPYYSGAAAAGNEKAVHIARFSKEAAEKEKISVRLNGLSGNEIIEIFTADSVNNGEKQRTEFALSENCVIYLEMEANSSVLFKISKRDVEI